MLKKSLLDALTLIRMALLRASHRWGERGVGWKKFGWGVVPLPKICHTYATMMKLDRDLS